MSLNTQMGRYQRSRDLELWLQAVFPGGCGICRLGYCYLAAIVLRRHRDSNDIFATRRHIHEMLYGYLPAVITGFLLTAVPNWTGRLPLRGGGLAALVGVWLAGRIAICLSATIGPLAAGATDTAFLLLVAAAAAREVTAARNWRNLVTIVIVVVLFAGNVTFHIEDYEGGAAPLGTRLGIAAVIALISLIGGRVVPSFTRNWLVRENPGRLPVPFGQFDRAVLVLSVLALALWIALPQWTVTAALLLIAGVAQAVRLGRWAGDRTMRDMLVLVLHVGYAFLPLGFLLLAAAIFFPQRIPVSGGIPAWTVGAVGVMTLAIMTRASLGHTGWPLYAGRLTQAIYAFVVMAALVRIAAAFGEDLAVSLLLIAGGLWIAGFWLFVIGYGPLLFGV